MLLLASPSTYSVRKTSSKSSMVVNWLKIKQLSKLILSDPEYKQCDQWAVFEDLEGRHLSYLDRTTT